MSKRPFVQVASDDEEEKKSENSGMEEMEDAKPLGEVMRVSGNGTQRRSHYSEFQYEAEHYHLGDSALFTPEEQTQKPYVAIIKDISVDHHGNVNVVGQWFYRPEETNMRGGGCYHSDDVRELFYSFHRDELPAESVMHKCVVHFIPPNKQLPHRQEHPGFVVQKVYCTQRRRVFKLTDKDYEDDKQEEIDFLVQRTMSRLGDLPDVDIQPRHHLLPELHAGATCPSAMSRYFATLYEFNAFTGDSHRDKWLEKLLQVIHAVCISLDGQTDGKGENGNDERIPDTSSGSTQLGICLQDKSQDVGSFFWPDRAVPAVASLENAIHEFFLLDYQKYNQKMRQMTYNLKPNALLSQRFLNGELEPLQILNMTPNELKEGLVAKEIESTQPEETQHLQMTDARCSRCSKKQVGLRNIIQAGRGDRYQLECANCGNTWYASRDQAAILTIGGSSGPTSVSTAPSATAKFEDVEKVTTKTEKTVVDIMKKAPETFVADKSVANVCATRCA